PATWDRLRGDAGLPVEDHPQYRFVRLLDLLGLTPADVRPWDDGAAPAPARNRLVSLALRPAPVTDQWLDEGPGLADIAGATASMTLIEAPGPREEALAIALTLRQAVEDGRTAALVTPDRVLTRRVAAALDRWGPDRAAQAPAGTFRRRPRPAPAAHARVGAASAPPWPARAGRARPCRLGGGRCRAGRVGRLGRRPAAGRTGRTRAAD
nr:hypothetical protein [Paracoccaceae bacterium]